MLETKTKANTHTCFPQQNKKKDKNVGCVNWESVSRKFCINWHFPITFEVRWHIYTHVYTCGLRLCFILSLFCLCTRFVSPFIDRNALWIMKERAPMTFAYRVQDTLTHMRTHTVTPANVLWIKSLWTHRECAELDVMLSMLSVCVCAHMCEDTSGILCACVFGYTINTNKM